VSRWLESVRSCKGPGYFGYYFAGKEEELPDGWDAIDI